MQNLRNSLLLVALLALHPDEFYNPVVILIDLLLVIFVGLFQENIGMSFVKSAMLTGIIVIAITLIAAYFTEETFHKDLNYTEPEDVTL